MNKIDKCKYIQTNIIKLCQTENDEVFKILYQNKSTYTQNNNGIFVNLSWLDDDIIDQIYNYISFCLKSQTEITKYEIMKNTYHNNMVQKEKLIDDTKSNADASINNSSNVSKQQKISSSMKFYLLKKKFINKNIINVCNINNLLTHEEYVM